MAAKGVTTFRKAVGEQFLATVNRLEGHWQQTEAFRRADRNPNELGRGTPSPPSSASLRYHVPQAEKATATTDNSTLMRPDIIVQVFNALQRREGRGGAPHMKPSTHNYTCPHVHYEQAPALITT